MVSILIVNYNTCNLLRNCLQSIQTHVSIPHEVIVVDNASTDGSYETLLPEFPEVIFIKSETNLGFAKGNNLALDHAVGDYIFYLNPDTIVTETTVEILVNYLKHNPDVGIVAPQLRYGNGEIQRSTRPFYTFWGSLVDNRFMNPVLAKFPKLAQQLPVIRNHEESGFTDWVKGAAFLMRGDLARELNGFDEQFWIYGEEMDLCKRVHQNGYKVYFMADVKITHLEGQSTRQSSEKMFIQNYKSFYLYLTKNHSPNELKWYHRRVKWFIELYLIKSRFNKSSEQSKKISSLYHSLKLWVHSEGENLVQQALTK